MSDNQLLLYAYLQELSQVEDNQEMTGEEKSNKKQDLMKKIEELADSLHIYYSTEQEDKTEFDTETNTEINKEAGTVEQR